jgi:hypothetical protein
LRHDADKRRFAIGKTFNMSIGEENVKNYFFRGPGHNSGNNHDRLRFAFAVVAAVHCEQFHWSTVTQSIQRHRTLMADDSSFAGRILLPWRTQTHQGPAG